jgi:hypothetical protein
MTTLEANSLWIASDFCLATTRNVPDTQLAEMIYQKVCRTGFAAPGFCLVDLGQDVASKTLRQFMVSLKQLLQQIHQSLAHRDLAFLSAARFDQQVTTKLHRDGGPDECFLMLGYEPSPVSAEILLADYSRCAHDRGLTPSELLEKHNPMFGPGEELLRPYITRVACFSNRSSQILLINNSVTPYSNAGDAWQGVLHTATVHNASDAFRRVVNSTMVASVPLHAIEPVSPAEQEEFITTDVVRRRGYDKTHLDDDM